jgi:hypothetical protein
MRAAASDLTVAISPLGLVELADEEFEVHGPRLNRYAQAWAFYLGHHWAYKREVGEAQITFNYTRAFADYLNNFTFSRGVYFTSPREYEHIIPALLKRVWEVDNLKDQVLWEIGNQGGISGDAFVKVAYEPAYEDTSGLGHPGRVRILPLNASFCFPEYHPHDRDRLLRFKMKYRFWGTSTEGTRQVYTYTEILTDEWIEEYVNDELIDQRPNPLGVIPVVHIRNFPVSGSPWGLSDIGDIIGLNRDYNEKASDVGDIINYHAAPVTIITGAKAGSLEKGAKKVWGGLPKDANVFNLENAVNLGGPLEFLELLKRSMHEITGVPESALGQMQPISNTSGVALSIQFQPLMMKYHLKCLQYGTGIKRVNDFVLRTLFIMEPDTLIYNPDTEGILKPGMITQIDPADPMVYVTEVQWPPPLPVDVLIKLNEIQAKMALGLESTRGALVSLGEQFPDEKVEELFEEQVEDAKRQGALSMLRSQINSAIVALTGIAPEGTEPPETQEDADGNPVNAPGGPGPISTPLSADYAALSAQEIQQMTVDIVTQAYGTKLPQRSNPDKNND